MHLGTFCTILIRDIHVRYIYFVNPSKMKIYMSHSICNLMGMTFIVKRQMPLFMTVMDMEFRECRRDSLKQGCRATVN